MVYFDLFSVKSSLWNVLTWTKIGESTSRLKRLSSIEKSTVRERLKLET